MSAGARENLIIYRVRSGLTQAEMAAKLGFSRQHYARIENGTQEASIRFLVKLGELFGITIDEAKELTKIESI